MSDNALQKDDREFLRETHYRCGGVLRWELQPRSLHLQESHLRASLGTVFWRDSPEVMSRCDRCGLVGIPVEPANA